MTTQILEARISHVEGIVEQINERMGGVERRLDSIETRFDARFNWVIGIILGTWITTILTVIFHQ
jgi:hypothetical protein